MYGQHDNHTFISYSYSDHIPLLNATATIQPNVSPECLTTTYSGGGRLDSTGYNTTCSNDSSTYMSTSLLQRSISSHSLQKYINTNNNKGWFSRMGLASESESDSNPVRRVFSTGDIQKINTAKSYSRSESPLSSESNNIVESMTKAHPYSPEQKKERIERYRSKRSQRNFTKKIKYECRKTLADSRPRVRGRFARNNEIEKSSQSSQWSHESVEEYDEDDNWLNFLDSFPANLIP